MLRSAEDPPGQNEPMRTPAVSDKDAEKLSDLDLRRAKDLVELHYNVKLKYLQDGPDPELRQARDNVRRTCTATFHKASA